MDPDQILCEDTDPPYLLTILAPIDYVSRAHKVEIPT